MEVLNKSAVVLLVACWETFVEELVTNGYEALLAGCPTPANVPKKLLAVVARNIKSDKDEAAVWQLAGDGWRAALTAHAASVLKQHIGPFHSPNSENVAKLFEEMLGIRDLRNSWHWAGMTKAGAVTKLDGLVDLRHTIAHKVKAPAPVGKQAVIDRLKFVMRLAGESSKAVSRHVRVAVGKYPWPFYKFTKT